MFSICINKSSHYLSAECMAQDANHAPPSRLLINYW